MSLRMRASKLTERFGFSISHTLLKSIYDKDDVRSVKPSIKFYRSVQDPVVLRLEKQAFVSKLSAAMRA